MGLRLSSATVITAITLTVVPACASTNEKGSSPSSRDVISSATDCAALAEELLLENAAQGFVETRSPGGERSCAIEVRAGSAALRQLGLNAEGCPPEASIILPFARSAEGWSLDRQGLSELDNGDCFS